jgi:hypothetical protein
VRCSKERKRTMYQGVGHLSKGASSIIKYKRTVTTPYHALKRMRAIISTDRAKTTVKEDRLTHENKHTKQEIDKKYPSNNASY